MDVSVIEINEPRRATGNIGPCSHVDCDERATRIVDVFIEGVVAHTWVCGEHFDVLAAIAKQTA